MNTFKLIFLPFLAFQRVIRVMDLIDLFELSQTSKRMSAKVKLAKKKILPIYLFISNYLRTIQISDYKDKHGENRNFKLNFSFYLEDYDFIRREIQLDDGHSTIGMSCIRRNNKRNPGYFGPFSNQNYFGLLEHLLRLFWCSGICISIEKRDITEQFLASPVLPKCLNDQIFETSNTVLTEDDVLNVLKYINPTNGLSLECRLSDGFCQKQIFELPRLYIRDAKWIGMEDLLNMKCQVILLEDHNFQVEDMKQVVRAWMAGGIPNIHRLRIKRLADINWDDFFGDIHHDKWDGKRRSRYFLTHSAHTVWFRDCKEGLDFERNDGKLASVLQDSEHFDFVVWHDRFPKIDD